MRNYIKYRQPALDLFQSFLSGEIKPLDLLSGLRAFEFPINRFKGLVLDFNGASLTIPDVMRQLGDATELKTLMQSAINNPKQLKIHFI